MITVKVANPYEQPLDFAALKAAAKTVLEGEGVRAAKVGLAFVYRPALDRQTYQQRVVEAAVAPLLQQGASAVLAAFVNVAAENEDHLRQLEQLVAARRKKR